MSAVVLRSTRPLAILTLIISSACAPTVLEVSPARVAAGETITVSGTYLSSAATARLVTGNGSSIQLLVSGGTATGLSARVPLATPAGVYDVVVVVDGSEARLNDALTVVAGTLRIRFLDVGQGDATLITGPDGQSLLFDGGNRGNRTVIDAAVDAVGGVDHVAVSHTDADHLNGVVEFLAGLDGVAGTDDDVVPETRWVGYDDTSCSSRLCGEFSALRADFERPLVGDTLEFGEAIIEVVGRDTDFGGGPLAGATDANERSLAIVVRYAGRSVFIGGDLTGGGLGSADVEAIAGAVIGPVDVLRVNHHGSATSTSAGFLAALQPLVAVISVGTDNTYCHPEASVLTRLQAAGPAIFSTGGGTVTGNGRCTPTAWPAGSVVGIGTIDLVVEVDGTLTVDGTEF